VYPPASGAGIIRHSDFVIGDTMPAGDEVAHYGFGYARPLRLLDGPDGALCVRHTALERPPARGRIGRGPFSFQPEARRTDGARLAGWRGVRLDGVLMPAAGLAPPARAAQLVPATPLAKPRA
jgi:hypothetical protein